MLCNIFCLSLIDLFQFGFQFGELVRICAALLEFFDYLLEVYERSGV
jgi:hypothetical protein